MEGGFGDHGRDSGYGRGRGHGISVDVADHGGEFVVTADLPGYDKEDIDLSVSERMLTIGAARDYEGEEGDESYLRRERGHASVRRSVRLPESVDEHGAGASYHNGVLTITLPKIDVDDDARRIDID